MKKRLRLAFVLLLIPALLLSGLSFYLCAWGRHDRAQPADAIVIFGARVTPSGAASPILRARTRRGFDLWQRKLAPLLVCTGGVGTYPPAEAEVEKRLLMGWGVPESVILVDETSTSTLENARNAASLLPPSSRVIAVSEPFHLWRCCRNCARFGLKALPSPDLDGWNALRPINRAFYALRESIVVLRDTVSSSFHEFPSSCWANAFFQRLRLPRALLALSHQMLKAPNLLVRLPIYARRVKGKLAMKMEPIR